MNLVDDATSEPLSGVRHLAEQAANQRGVSFIGGDLRLFQGIKDLALAQPVDELPPEPVSPFSLGRAYELLLAPSARQKKGAHLTPETVARNLVDMIPNLDSTAVVLDPSVGGAAFLLAAADRLVAAGATPQAAISQLRGVDIDAGAVAVAEAAIALWGIDREVAATPLPQLWCGDGLLDELPGANCVVGNPPFLTQLRSTSSHTADRRAALRDRWGELVGAYTDDAWLFVVAGLQALAPLGALALVQPVSVLAARHGDAIRRHVSETATMTGLWIARDQVFDAAVQVCGVVLQRSGGESSSGPTTVVRRVGAAFEPLADLSEQPRPDRWGSAAAAALAVPEIDLAGRGGSTVRDLATATAGFRDQFYGFVPFVSDGQGPTVPPGHARLVTVGMIDVLSLDWGTKPFKFAKRAFTYPLVDMEALEAADPTLYGWTMDRRRPKLLMATQTRVVEVWVDENGGAVPATPVLSIEPIDDDLDALWMLAAALSAPAVSAHHMAAKFGTAMSLNSMKLSARDVLSTPLPSIRAPWEQAAAILRSEAPDLREFAQLMGVAYDATGPAVIDWWISRLPNRS